jgi:hypothetical protein
MNEETPKRVPDFDWLLSDHLSTEGEPDDIWKRKWAGCPDVGGQVRELLGTVIESLEGLAPVQTENLHQILKEWAEMWVWSIDWWYCKDAMTRIPEITDRFEKLSPILTRVTHRKEANVCLREATQCYLYGFFQASTALFRTALETGLRDFCVRKLGSKPGVGVVLDDLITRALRFHLLSQESGAMATGVRKIANRVVHDEPIDEGQAFEVLVQTRRVLEEIYG